MGLFSIRKKMATRQNSAPQISLPDKVSKEPVFAYRGGVLAITLQKAKARFVDSVGPVRIKWNKESRLGITFTDSDDGAIVIKHSDRQPNDVWVGQELLAVNGVPVNGMDFDSVMERLRTCAAPCMLDFTPPPSPVVASAVTGAAATAGIEPGMVLKTINGASISGASLSEVQKMLKAASDKHPCLLAFAPYNDYIRAEGSVMSKLSNMKTHLRNTVCVATVTMVAAFSA
ncbi:TPA: hypothetical protein N0F65_002944 [Lagenidium giganteum]|uniref:PDZ domain-containing protein n=1 Tax=Lagenidium giganteum TaxID=4803 RepID=A0AAV2Z397_9STRA|nr:TPA: hypothetical protein N0F65_002944 [Lagenidium giganteum]